mmetsp:Transcript_106223/g.193345  ORF Transcript_106223/g.193345 Transcript_106223/m.193345 type:complete len:489 (-) Transcript_106223:67-1533(-)
MPVSDGTIKLSLAAALLATLAVTWVSRTLSRSRDSRKTQDERFSGFQRTYLMVYLTGMMADWLQGPYVYALYEAYGFSRTDNAMLFIFGFGSSAIFGTFVGGLADKLGRRKFALLYCVMYGISCLTKHVNSFAVLLLGRLTGGIATSLLFSVFDSWMVSEHNRRNFDSELLGSTFSLAVFGNSVVAILAGEVGQMAADSVEMTPAYGDVYYGGYCMPFDVAIVFLVICMVVMTATWGENYGSKSSSGSSKALQEGMRLAFNTVMQQPQVLYCGIVCSFFEASMFIFVFMWTPALTEEGAPKPAYGHIFAGFMLMSMLGSQIFSLESQRRSVESIGQLTLVLAACSNLVSAISTDTTVRFLAFLVFEMCVGLYFPMMGTLKGKLVPEESRTAIYNVYRLPLNIIVVLALVGKLDIQIAFGFTSVMLLVAALVQGKLIAMRSAGAASQYRPVSSVTATDMEFGLEEVDAPGMGDELEDDLKLATVLGSKS